MKQWDPSFYNSSSNLQYDVALSIIHAERIPTDAKILDVGCGSGKITHYLSQLTPSGDVKVIDLEEKMVAYAKAHNPSANSCYENIDVTHFTECSTYDYVFSFWTLSWIPPEKQADALRAISKSLKDNGVAILMYPLKHNIYAYVEILLSDEKWRHLQSTTKIKMRPFISCNDYKAILEKEIHTENHIEEKTILYPFTSIESFKKSITTWLTVIDELSSEKKEIFLNELVSRYMLGEGLKIPAMEISYLDIRIIGHNQD